MKLLDIAPDRLSLEYTPGEADTVRARLNQLGVVSVERRATYDVIRVAGEELVHEDAWDEPCLIARSAAGSALLRLIADGQDSFRLAG